MHKYLRYKVFVLSNCKIKVFKSFYKSFRLKVFIEKTLKPYIYWEMLGTSQGKETEVGLSPKVCRRGLKLDIEIKNRLDIEIKKSVFSLNLTIFCLFFTNLDSLKKTDF